MKTALTLGMIFGGYACLADEKPVAPPKPPPLVTGENLIRLHPKHHVWIDRARTRVLVGGEVCLRKGMLELLACIKTTKEHEAIVAVYTRAQIVHAALLTIGAKPGAPAKFEEKVRKNDKGEDVFDFVFHPPHGSKIEVKVHWFDADGKHKTARAQDWIIDHNSKKALTHPWVFGGSGFVEIDDKGTKHYQADDGDFICVTNFSSAMLDIPIESTTSNEALLWVANTQKIPPLSTPVTLELRVVNEVKKK